MTQGRRLVAVLCGLMMAGGLTGCYSDRQTVGVGTPFRFGVWQDHHYDNLVCQLRLRGVQVVRVGDSTRLILSTDNFFKINSVELEPGAHLTLHLVARLINYCPQGRAIVTGHVDNVFNDTRRENLAAQQARVVAAELWANGIPNSRMLVSGRSNREQIATDRTVFGSGDNRRIEIRLY